MARTIAAGALLCGLAVGLGAFAAHGLRGQLGVTELGWIETGVRYQMYHGLALLGVGILERLGTQPAQLLTFTEAAFVLGTVCFSGSLYGLSFHAPVWVGWITPLGGLLLLAGWLSLAIAAWDKF